MQKKFLAVAAVALVSIPALGQLSIYGTVDLGFQHLDLGKRLSDGKEVTSLLMSSGLLSSPRIGFKGEQSLGMYGLQAGFQLETGFSVQGGQLVSYEWVNMNKDLYRNTATALFARQARVYLSSTLGEVSFGRQPSPFSFIEGEIDPSHAGLSMTSANLFKVIPYTSTVENSVAYHTPDYNGLSACFMVALHEPQFSMTPAQDKYMDDTAGQLRSASLEYSSGPLYVGLGYTTENFASVTSRAINSPGHNAMYLAGVSYDFGIAKAYVSYFAGKSYNPITVAADGTASSLTETLKSDATVASIGVSVPVADFGYVLANMGQMTNKSVTDAGARIFGLGYAYSFNRSATFYAGYAKLTNVIKDGIAGSGLMLNGALSNHLTLPKPDASPQSLEVGFRYRF